MEYVTLAGTAKLGPLVAPISSVPEILPVGLAPSAVNLPEKITSFTFVGIAVEPA
jgi:hypothetical protein